MRGNQARELSVPPFVSVVFERVAQASEWNVYEQLSLALLHMCV